jgi:hypothetical protein
LEFWGEFLEFLEFGKVFSGKLVEKSGSFEAVFHKLQNRKGKLPYFNQYGNQCISLSPAKLPLISRLRRPATTLVKSRN